MSVGIRVQRCIVRYGVSLVLGLGLLAAAGSDKTATMAAVPQTEIRSAPPVLAIVSAGFGFPRATIEFDRPLRKAAPAFRKPTVAAKTEALAPPGSLLPPRADIEPFSNDVSGLASGGMVRKWRSTLRRMRAEQRVLERCRKNQTGCPEAAKRFLAIIEDARAYEGERRIAQVNRAINLNIRGVTDMQAYGVVEYWATPLETFAKGAGDCEDYAIAKYAALRELGVPAADLRLVVVRDNKAKDYHAAAAVRSGDRWLILDNRTLGIRADRDIAEFDPLFVLDHAGVRRFDAVAGKSRRLNPEFEVSASEDTSTSCLSEVSPL